MQCTGHLTNVNTDWETGKVNLTFSINERSVLQELNNIKDCEKLTITAKKFREKRSLDANGTLWWCIGKMAEALRADKWDIYLRMLKRYGKFTYVVVKPNAVDSMKAQWRECEVVGEITVNGREGVQMLCYFGSSTYDTKEFSVLLDGVISEMKELGLETPTSEDMRAALAKWEEQHG